MALDINTKKANKKFNEKIKLEKEYRKKFMEKPKCTEK